MNFFKSKNSKDVRSDTDEYCSEDEMSETTTKRLNTEITADDFLAGLEFTPPTKNTKKDVATKNPGILRNSTGYFTLEDHIIINAKEHKHSLIEMPIKQQFFCTHCLGSYPIIDLDVHIKSCFFATANSLSAAYCPCCNAKATPDNAQQHFNSHSHLSRMAFIKSLIANDEKYYITAASASTTKPKSDLEFYELDLKYYVRRIDRSNKLYQQFKKPGDEQLCELLSQMMQIKKTGNKQQIDLISRNRVINLFEQLLCEINAGMEQCHYAAKEDDFIHSVNIKMAVKRILQRAVHNESTNNDAKKKKLSDLEKIFSVAASTDDKNCCICQNKHAFKTYLYRETLFKIVESIKNQIDTQ